MLRISVVLITIQQEAQETLHPLPAKNNSNSNTTNNSNPMKIVMPDIE